MLIAAFVIPIDELALRLVGGRTPLQAFVLLFRIESSDLFHDSDRFVVDYRRSKLVRAMRAKTV
eukprot:scaffold649_cov347-Pavlova_lutheri.AAC.123